MEWGNAGMSKAQVTAVVAGLVATIGVATPIAMSAFGGSQPDAQTLQSAATPGPCDALTTDDGDELDVPLTPEKADQLHNEREFTRQAISLVEQKYANDVAFVMFGAHPSITFGGEIPDDVPAMVAGTPQEVSLAGGAGHNAEEVSQFIPALHATLASVAPEGVAITAGQGGPACVVVDAHINTAAGHSMSDQQRQEFTARAEMEAAAVTGLDVQVSFSESEIVSGEGPGKAALHDWFGGPEPAVPPVVLAQNEHGCWGHVLDGEFQTLAMPRGEAIPRGDQLEVNGALLDVGDSLYYVPVRREDGATFPDGCPQVKALYINQLSADRPLSQEVPEGAEVGAPHTVQSGIR